MAATMNSKATFEKVGPCVFNKDWEALAQLATKECMVTADGITKPWMDNWKGLYDIAGKIRWLTVYTLVTPTKLIYRCYDYIENKDGSKCSMFYIDGVVTLDAESGKITNLEYAMNPDQMEIFMAFLK